MTFAKPDCTLPRGRQGANGVINMVAIQPPVNWPHVSEPVTTRPATAPAWMPTSSNTIASAATKNASSKAHVPLPLVIVAARLGE
jgi:hypothetical protein